MTLIILLWALAIYCCYNCNESLDSFANLGKLKLQMQGRKLSYQKWFQYRPRLQSCDIALLCDIEEKAWEKVRQNRRLCGKIWQGEELERRGGIGNSSPQISSNREWLKRVIMIPLRPKCGTLSGIWRYFLCEIWNWPHQKIRSQRAVNWWKRPRRGKLSNLSEETSAVRR